MLELANVNSPLTMSSREIAELMGKEHRNVMRDIRNMLLELHGEGGVLSFEHTYTNPQNGQEYPVFMLPKRETLILVSGYKLALRAKIIDRWAELEAGKAAPAAPALPSPAVEAMQFAEAAANMLRLEGSARLGLARSVTTIVAPHLLPALPVYAIDAPTGSTAGSSEPTDSLTNLLRQKGSAVSAVKANRVLQRLGFLDQITRPSRGGTKQYWSVTESGLRYGKNVTSEKNQNETQPHWFVSRADELIRLIEANA